MTDNQALNLGMAMHLLFNSLSYGRDIVNKSMECHSHDRNNTVTINYSFIGGHLTINWVTVGDNRDDDMTIALRRMVATLEDGEDSTTPLFNIDRCNGLYNSPFHTLADDEKEWARETIANHNTTYQQCSLSIIGRGLPPSTPKHSPTLTPSYLQHQRMKLATKLYSQFLSEYTGSIADVEDDSKKLASVAVASADILINQLKSQES
jgi:hypothetical protein